MFRDYGLMWGELRAQMEELQGKKENWRRESEL